MWRASDSFTATDDQLEKQIRAISLGLLEVSRETVNITQDTDSEILSVDAGAGSLNIGHGDSRIIQVIHESVRDLFLRGEGFYVLDQDLKTHPLGKGHLSIMGICLDYIQIEELNALVEARQRPVCQQSQKAAESESNEVLQPLVHSLHHDGHATQNQKALQIRTKRVSEEDWKSQLDLSGLSESAVTLDIVQWLAKNTEVTDHSNALEEDTARLSPRLLGFDPVSNPGGLSRATLICHVFYVYSCPSSG
ncbi:hypothetical protein ACHAPU_006171 [Fusarium lateritium]